MQSAHLKITEVGVYRGASARPINEADQSRPLHLFDTFEGLPEPAPGDSDFRNGAFAKGQFACALDEVKNYVGSSSRVYFHPGLFPQTADPVADQLFSFVHSDVDLYASTRSVVEFFYPRLVPGGVMLFHDFHSGSIRIPAAACGLVGLKVTRGRISQFPGDEITVPLAVQGFLSRSVRDTAACLDFAVGQVPGDPTPPPLPLRRILRSFLQVPANCA